MSEPVTPRRRPRADHDSSDEVRPPWSRSDRLVPRRVVRPLQEFLQTSTAGASLLLVAVVVALVWANSPWKAGYESLFCDRAVRAAGCARDLDEDLHFWVNDGLMAAVLPGGRSRDQARGRLGELRRLRVARVAGRRPRSAAWSCPALIYLAIAGGGEAGRGWGIPMATDIAFALGVLALAAAHAPPRLKPFLLTLAIVDDIGAIIVIAIFYTGGVAVVRADGRRSRSSS